MRQNFHSHSRPTKWLLFSAGRKCFITSSFIILWASHHKGHIKMFLKTLNFHTAFSTFTECVHSASTQSNYFFSLLCAFCCPHPSPGRTSAGVVAQWRNKKTLPTSSDDGRGRESSMNSSMPAFLRRAETKIISSFPHFFLLFFPLFLLFLYILFPPSSVSLGRVVSLVVRPPPRLSGRISTLFCCAMENFQVHEVAGVCERERTNEQAREQ